MIEPQFLKAKDKIGILAPAGFISEEEVQCSISIFNDWDLEVELGKNIFKRKNNLAGNDKQRKEDFQRFINRKDIKAIICARGGYGSIRIIDDINFENFRNNAKWIVGYSDITIFHSYLQKKLHCESIHAIMPRNFQRHDLKSQPLKSLKNALFGKDIDYKVRSHPLNRSGTAEGILVGGNLSVLYSLQGTHLEIDTKGKILFIEDVNEYLYHVDRMITNLNLSGKLNNLKGLIVGCMSRMKDSPVAFGETAYEIINRAVDEYDYPVIYDFPAGHTKTNMALILGKKVLMSTDKQESEVVFK
jgi:muramoyltetrapeptide carboxypeptidase